MNMSKEMKTRLSEQLQSNFRAVSVRLLDSVASNQNPDQKPIANILLKNDNKKSSWPTDEWTNRQSEPLRDISWELNTHKTHLIKYATKRRQWKKNNNKEVKADEQDVKEEEAEEERQVAWKEIGSFSEATKHSRMGSDSV